MKICPFCLSHGGAVVVLAARLFCVECRQCGAGSEPATSEDGAVTNWQRRVRAHEARPAHWFPRPAAQVA